MPFYLFVPLKKSETLNFANLITQNENNMNDLKNKNALITGAGKGIGKAVAIALAKEGVNVILVARTQSDLDEVAQEVTALGVKSLTLIADVADINSVNIAVEKALSEFKTIDILINNAGIAAFGKFLELEPEAWERIIQVNLMGTYYATRAVLPNMIERQTGDIINISSTAGLSGNALTSAYSASKFAVLGLTESLMQEVRKHNIRVTALTPSTVATNMAKELKLTDGNPDKVMQAEDMAELIIAQLKLNRRVFIKNSSIWSTNP
ncbi:3-oxoacyl-[acyl-carrier protein] reductase [Flavobacterium fryxellicola]|nr:3-oxoacyl-[acyl-carrier protein] reductase [Flavobacterium fryxellicola]